MREPREHVEETASFFEEIDTVETHILESEAIVDTIIEYSRDHDVTIIGATREGLLQRLIFSAIPEEIGRRAANTDIMAKRNQDITSRATRWFRRRLQ